MTFLPGDIVRTIAAVVSDDTCEDYVFGSIFLVLQDNDNGFVEVMSPTSEIGEWRVDRFEKIQ